MTVRVKICGITDPEDARMCVEEGADALGFVVEHPQSNPWNLDRTRAAELMRTVPPFVTRVAVVGGDAPWILRIAEATVPHALQLHRDESEDCVREVARALEGSGIQVVKALRIDPGADLPLSHWVELARRFVGAGADAILVDSVTAERPAGTGRAVDAGKARAVVEAHHRPSILAGGLTPENVGAAIAAVGPYAVDVISAVEDSDHRKVRERVRAFIESATMRS
ncbi:MAG: phosphoribosylanthranilate isomerase [Acidimicrobiia bacterium]